MIDVDKAIGTAVKTGKVVLGANNAIKNAQAGKAKLIVVSALTIKEPGDSDILKLVEQPSLEGEEVEEAPFETESFEEEAESAEEEAGAEEEEGGQEFAAEDEEDLGEEIDG
jgi:hypothetical protein